MRSMADISRAEHEIEGFVTATVTDLTDARKRFQ